MTPAEFVGTTIGWIIAIVIVIFILLIVVLEYALNLDIIFPFQRLVELV